MTPIISIDMLNSRLSSIYSFLPLCPSSLFPFHFFPFALPCYPRPRPLKLFDPAFTVTSTPLNSDLNQVTVNNEKFVSFFVVHFFPLFLSFPSSSPIFCIFFFLGTVLGTVTRLRAGRSWLRFVADSRDVSVLRDA
jgi:hypothetical protein